MADWSMDQPTTRRLNTSSTTAQQDLGLSGWVLGVGVGPGRPVSFSAGGFLWPALVMRTCNFHCIRLSVCSCRCCGCALPWCGDSGAAVAVSHDGEPTGSEQFDPSCADLPSGEVATGQGVHVQSEVSFLQPCDRPRSGCSGRGSRRFVLILRDVTSCCTSPAAPSSVGVAEPVLVSGSEVVVVVSS